MPSDKLFNFNLGEGLVAADLNANSNSLMYRMRDQMLFNKENVITAAGSFSTNAANHTAGQTSNVCYRLSDFAGATYFTGGGLELTLYPGTIGTYIATAAPSPTTENYLTYQINENDEVLTFTTNSGGGSDRMDAVVAVFTKTTDTPTTRDFKDATTSALSTASFDKHDTTDVAFAVKTGTNTLFSGVTIAANERVLSFINVSTSDVLTIHDVMLPMEQPIRDVNGLFLNISVNWTQSPIRWNSTTAGPDSLNLFPSEFIGDQRARVLSLTLTADLTTGDAVLLELQGFTTSSAVLTLTTEWFANVSSGVLGTHTFSFMPERGDTNIPIWMAGARNPGTAIETTPLNPLKLKVVANSLNGQTVSEVSWLIAR